MSDNLKKIGERVYTPPGFYEFVESIRSRPWYVRLFKGMRDFILGMSVYIVWIVLMFVVVFGIGKITTYYQDTMSPEHIYVVVAKLSSSGDIRFREYDFDSGEVVDVENERSWFWITPYRLLESENGVDEWVRYISEHRDSVFQVSIRYNDPDCDYWDSGDCVDNILIRDTSEMKIVGKL